jgi:hypothetical protein
MAAAPAFFTIWAGYGFFFVTAVTAQLAFAVTLWVFPSLWRDNPHPALLWAGLLGNALIVLLWLFTRTAGIPFAGPRAGEVLGVGVLDVLAVLLELGVIGAVALLLRIYGRLGREAAANGD